MRLLIVISWLLRFDTKNHFIEAFNPQHFDRMVNILLSERYLNDSPTCSLLVIFLMINIYSITLNILMLM